MNVLVDVWAVEESLDAERGMVHRVWDAMTGVVILAAALIVFGRCCRSQSWYSADELRSLQSRAYKDPLVWRR